MTTTTIRPWENDDEVFICYVPENHIDVAMLRQSLERTFMIREARYQAENGEHRPYPFANPHGCLLNSYTAVNWRLEATPGQAEMRLHFWHNYTDRRVEIPVWLHVYDEGPAGNTGFVWRTMHPSSDDYIPVPSSIKLGREVLDVLRVVNEDAA